MSMFLREQSGLSPESRLGLLQPLSAQARPISKGAAGTVLISILVGMIGIEWSWLQGISARVYGPIIGLGAIGILCAGLMIGAFSSPGKRFLLIVWFFSAILVKQFVKTPYDMPLSVETWKILFAYFTAAIAGLAGLHIGTDSATARWFLRRSAGIFAIISIIAFICGTPPGNANVTFPAMYVGFPIRLFTLFAFCWYLDKWLQGKWISWNLIGLSACSLSVLVVFHKPIVFSGIVAILATAILQLRRGSFAWSIIRLAILVAISIAGFMVVDTLQGGGLSDQYLDIVYKSFFHQSRVVVNEMSADELWVAWGAGRFKMWDIAMERFDQSPIFGTGIGQAIWGSSGIIPLHNQYLDILLSVGIFGSIPVIFAIYFWIRAALRRLRGTDADWVLPICAFVVGIAGYGMGGTPNLFPYLCVFLFFCMGMVAAPVRLSMSNSE